MIKYKNLSNILEHLNIKKSFDVARYILRENHDINYFNNFKSIQTQTGGKLINFKYENHNVIFNIQKDVDRYIFSLHHNNNDNKDVCLIIFIADKIGYIENISYHKNCIDGLNYKGGGSTLLKIAINFLKQNKNKYNINKIQLKDNAFKYCQESGTKIRLSLLSTLTRGDTWYGLYGFIPYDSDRDIQNKRGCELYFNNKKIIGSVKVNDTNVEQYIRDALHKLKMEDYIEDIDELFKHYDNRPLSTFLYQFLNDFQEICFIFDEFYIKLSQDLKIFDFHGSSFYLPLF